ncbi:MAG: malto-oligosyltrehalose synthase [Bryobacteraceae bacterium]|nr:malto-oligosyltrehalose synthase [Bryobacteraceae bacterium]
MSSLERFPAGAYRVQFNARYGFKDALDSLPYIAGLGVTHLYASPILQARQGSTHGYDVTNPLRLNPELGSPNDFDALVAALAAQGMKLLLDIVPNHMAASSENPWWTDVLENGPSSPYATYFDIDWEPARGSTEEKVLLPILGSTYGSVLENQELIPAYENGAFVIRYYEARLPVDPSSYPAILGPSPAYAELPALADLIASFERLPPRQSSDFVNLEARARESRALKEKLAALHAESGAVRAAFVAALNRLRGRKGEPESFDELDALLSAQTYVLAWWKAAGEKVNYRRFFDVSELVALRAQDDAVHEETHRLIYQLVREGKVHGLRIDHIDGLYDPHAYLDRVRAGTPGAYLVVEKILTGHERLPDGWPCDGTSGYDFLGAVNNLFVSRPGLENLDNLYRRLVGVDIAFEDIEYEQKKRVMKVLFAGEMLALAAHLALLAEQDRHARDLGPNELRRALIEVNACLPVYRTYARDERMSDADRAVLLHALEHARRRNTTIAPEVFRFLEQILLLRFPRRFTAQQRTDALAFVRRWQQLTGPVTAKGVEDTTLYLYNRLISVNDVGGRQEPVSPEEFHAFNCQRQKAWPATMNATSTHDTKRSEDVRARLNVLSELVAEWTRRVVKWRRWNRIFKTEIDGVPAPDANDEYLVYQTLVGAWPLDDAELPQLPDRIREYMRKAVREGKRNSSWLTPNEPYEEALMKFVTGLLRDENGNPFLDDFLPLQRRVAFHGALNSLSQTLLKIASPGVPDFYQGTALWDLSLVDPDNRRPVDYRIRANVLEEIASWRADAALPLVDVLLQNWRDGGVKLYTIIKAMAQRRRDPDLFTVGEYLPIQPTGTRADNVVAFARRREDRWALSAVPRLLARLQTQERMPFGRPHWRDTALPLPEGAPRQWLNVYTGERVHASLSGSLDVHRVLRSFPVALLVPS